jgi:hypothetical protein
VVLAKRAVRMRKTFLSMVNLGVSGGEDLRWSVKLDLHYIDETTYYWGLIPIRTVGKKLKEVI